MRDLFDEYSGTILTMICMFFSLTFIFHAFLGPNSLVSGVINVFCGTLGLK